MSGKVIVSRNLILKSPLHLHKLLEDKIIDKHLAQKINDFNYYVLRYINGCKCDDDFNKSIVEEEFNNLISDLDFLEKLKSEFGCNDVIIQNDNW